MGTQPSVASDTPVSERAPLYAFAASLTPLGLPPDGVHSLFLRFEPMGLLQKTPTSMPSTVGVLATWRGRSLASGLVDHVRPLALQEARTLMQACAACGLRVVDNLPTKN